MCKKFSSLLAHSQNFQCSFCLRVYYWPAKRAILVLYTMRTIFLFYIYLSIYHGRCHSAISNLALNAHNFVHGCITVTSNLAINAYINSCVASQHSFSYTIINPRRACARVIVVVLSVCVSVCLSVKSHLASGASVRPENAVKHSVCRIFSETVTFQSYRTSCIVRLPWSRPFSLWEHAREPAIIRAIPTASAAQARKYMQRFCSNDGVPALWRTATAEVCRTPPNN